jgi:hypothetical protein
VRYLVLHKRFKRSKLAAWRDWLTIDPYHEDDDLIAYRTDPQAGRDLRLLSHNRQPGVDSCERDTCQAFASRADLHRRALGEYDAT